MATTTSTRTNEANRPASTRRKREQRTDIWSNLLRQTREAQARSRTQAVQARDLVLCGGSPTDQREFVERYIARPPPAQAAARNQRDQRPAKPKGEVRLSNRFGYGYGHVTLYAPPQSSGSGVVGLFTGEAEEVAKVDVHTIPEAEQAYEETLRRLLRPKREAQQQEEQKDDEIGLGNNEDQGEERRPAICLLMSWKEPWLFLDRLRRWFALLSRALLPAAARKDENPIEVLIEHRMRLTVVLQHTDHQEMLLRDSYTEESFDYICQCLRTCLLPVSAALLFVPTSLPPQQAGGPLSEAQKVVFTNLDLNVAALQAKTGKLETAPKHNVVDRMAIVVPSGWDSLGKIRLLSESFSPEAVSEGWTTDLSFPVFPATLPQVDETPEPTTSQHEEGGEGHTNGGAEVYESSHQPSPLVTSPQPTPPMSPSKMPKSAITDYERLVQDPNAHKIPKPPQIEVSTRPEQEFLAEMRFHLQQYESQDVLRVSHASTTAGAVIPGKANAGAAAGAPSGEALTELGEVSFNVGGVSYDTRTAEQAIERLKRPAAPGSSDSRSGTPRPSRRDHKDGSEGTPGTGSKRGDIPSEELEGFFASLMKKGGGAGQSATPSKH